MSAYQLFKTLYRQAELKMGNGTRSWTSEHVVWALCTLIIVWALSILIISAWDGTCKS